MVYEKKKKKIKDPEEQQRRQEIKRRLWSEATLEWRPLALGCTAMLCSSLSNQALPRLMGKFIDQKSNRTGSSSSTSTLMMPWATVGCVVLGGGLASFVRTVMLTRAEDSITTRLRKQAFAAVLMDRSMEWFETETMAVNKNTKETSRPTDTTTTTTTTSAAETSAREIVRRAGVSPGAIGTILNEDVAKLSKSLTTNIASLVRSTSAVVFSTSHMLRLDPALFGLSVAVVPVIGAAAMLLRKSMKRLALQQQDMVTAAASFVEERLLHIAVVKISNREAMEVQQYCEMQDESLALARRACVHAGMLMGFLFVASSGALLLVVNVGGKSVAAGKMTSGQLTSFATYSFLLGLGTSGIVKAASEFFQGLTSAERFYRLIDGSTSSSSSKNETTAVDDDSKEEERVAAVDVDIQAIDSVALQDVCFSYKSTGTEVLQNVSLELQRGKVIALVGKNGSGKSTIASLLAGLYQPSSGRIELSDGTDLSRVSKTARKNIIQIVPQATALFNMSILENIRYSNPEASEEDAMRALKMANCDGLVSKLEGGIHFVVGLNGSKLSGGERQRLALARALLSDPVVQILDETESNMDSEGETAVSDALRACRGSDENGGKGRALLLITHQAKTLELADEIVVLKNGTIVERGLLSELRTDNSELSRLMPELV